MKIPFFVQEFTDELEEAAVDALRNEANSNIIGMSAIFTYQFNLAQENFTNANVDLRVLSNYGVLIEEAAKLGYVSPENIESLKEWRENPAIWEK